LVCMYFLFLSIPSARYTDKADGPRRGACTSADAKPGASQRNGGRPHKPVVHDGH